MNETMTAQEAARALAAASKYEGALARRTEGITWIIWALATPAIFVTYGFASVLRGAGWWMGLLWIPWVGMAVAGTVLLWRSVALAQPALRHDGDTWFWARFAAFSLALTALFYIVRPDGPELPLILVGGMWMGMGILNLWRADATGRVLAVLAGAPLAVSGALLSVLDAPIEVSGMVGILVSGLAPFCVGLWGATRG